MPTSDLRNNTMSSQHRLSTIRYNVSDQSCMTPIQDKSATSSLAGNTNVADQACRSATMLRRRPSKEPGTEMLPDFDMPVLAKLFDDMTPSTHSRSLDTTADTILENLEALEQASAYRGQEKSMATKGDSLGGRRPRAGAEVYQQGTTSSKQEVQEVAVTHRPSVANPSQPAWMLDMQYTSPLARWFAAQSESDPFCLRIPADEAQGQALRRSPTRTSRSEINSEARTGTETATARKVWSCSGKTATSTACTSESIV